MFDNDELDNLTVASSRLHIGRKNADATADSLLSDRSTAPDKAAILSALASFDLNEDEHDDTYDAEDVGGTVDSSVTGANEADADAQDRNEAALLEAYKATPHLFRRDAQTRRDPARAALKLETGMTDEAIEGWAVMIEREPKRLNKLGDRFASSPRQQPPLSSSAYRASAGDTDADGASSRDAAGQSSRGRGWTGRRRGRGGRGRGGRGDSVAGGPSDAQAVQAGRQRKEANKGSRANHNRRDQRAKKVARAGFAA